MKNLSMIILTVIFCGCAHTSVPLLFEPVSAPSISTIYTNGVPIASVSTDSLFLLLALDQTQIAGDKYFRLWILAQNVSDTNMLLEPSKTFMLNADPKELSKVQKNFSMSAQSPTVILNSIEDEEATHSIITAIGGALEAASAKNTTITSNRGDKYTVHDVHEKRDVINQQTSSSMTSISNWYSIFKSSITSGILRKNTLFPGQGVNGYLYFLNNMQFMNKRSLKDCNPFDFDYKVIVQLPSSQKTIVNVSELETHEYT